MTPIPIDGLFEAHLTVSDLSRSIDFYGGTLGLELAASLPDRRVAFFWLGGRGRSMLGLWDAGTAPQRMSLHVAFTVALPDLLQAPSRLRQTGVEPLDFWGKPTDEPVVLGWMPAAAIYFRDPDGNQLEFLSMLADPPRPDAGIVTWGQWLDA